MITAEQIISLVDLQKATNVAYFGETWKHYWHQCAVENSVFREWAEFLDEVTSDWKIYGDGIHFNHDKAVYEIVDVVHFMLCDVLIQGNESELAEQYELMGSMEFYVPNPGTIRLQGVTFLFKEFMRDPTCLNLGTFLGHVCSYLNIDGETYMKAHKRKNDRNRLRAAGGTDYDKSTETPLTLEF